MEIYNLVQACSTCQSNDLLPWSTSVSLILISPIMITDPFDRQLVD